MNTLTKLFAFALAITTTAAADAQVTGTSLLNKPTLTIGNYTSTNTFLYTDRTGIGVRKVTAPDILDFAGLGLTDVVTHAGAILNGNLTVTGTSALAGTLTLSGGLVSNSASISGTLTTTGFTGLGTSSPIYHLDVRSSGTASQLHIGTVSGGDIGIYQFFQDPTAYYFVNMHYNGSAYIARSTSAAGLRYSANQLAMTSNTGLSAGGTFTPTIVWQIGSLAGNNTVFNETGLDVDFRIEGDNEANLFALDAGLDRIGIGTASPSTLLHVAGAVTASSATIVGNVTVTGALSIQPGGNPSINLSNGSTPYCYLGGSSTLQSYVAMFNTAGIAFGHNTSPQVGLHSPAAGILRCNNTGTTGFGTFQTGGFAGNFRALAASGNITTTDTVVTLTGAITLSLPSTSITGQQFIVKNIGAVTGTATVDGGTKTIDGATTQAIISGAGVGSSLKFIYDGTNYIISQ